MTRLTCGIVPFAGQIVFGTLWLSLLVFVAAMVVVAILSIKKGDFNANFW
jgi:energy-converting hydrogenase Eha subunit H